MGWSSSKPTSGQHVDDSIYDGDYTQNWGAIEAWIGRSHYTFTDTSSLQGKHKIGITGFLYSGPDFGPLAGAPSGSMGYDSTYGILKLKDASSWNRLTETKWSRVRANKSTTQSIPASTWTKVTFSVVASSGGYDTLNEFSSSRITVKAAGYYLISAALHWPIDISENLIQMAAIYVNGASYAIQSVYSSAYGSQVISDIIYLTISDYVEIYAYHNDTASYDLTLGNFHLTRIN